MSAGAEEEGELELDQREGVERRRACRSRSGELGLFPDRGSG